MSLKYIKTAEQKLKTLAYLHAYWFMLMVIFAVITIADELSGRVYDLESGIYAMIGIWAIPSVPTFILYANYLKNSRIREILIDEKGVEISTSTSSVTLINWQDITALEKISSRETGLFPRTPWINGRFYFYRIITTETLPVIITCLLEQVEEGGGTIESIFEAKNIVCEYKENLYPFIKSVKP